MWKKSKTYFEGFQTALKSRIIGQNWVLQAGLYHQIESKRPGVGAKKNKK